MMKDRALLTAESLRFSYGPRKPEVLRGISMKIWEGSITALLGPNGSGKTTLLNLLLGWNRASSGRLKLSGRPISAFSKRERSRMIGLVPQEEPMSFELDVLDYVLLGRAPYLDLLETPGASDRHAAREVLDRLGLMGVLGRRVTALSGGEQQLVSLARALVQDPALLLLDEPLSHLDISNTQRILKILLDLKSGGKTMLFTTHDPNAAAAVADTVILLRKGRLVATGPMEKTLTSDSLSATYGTHVEVIRAGGRILIPLHMEGRNENKSGEYPSM